MNMYMYMCTIDVIVGFILWSMAEMLWRSVHEYLLLLVLFSGVVGYVHKPEHTCIL